MWQSPSRSQRLGSCGDECLRTYTCSSVIDTAAITIQMSTCVSEITSDNSLLKTAGQRSIHLGVILPQINSTYQVFREKCFYSAMSDFYTDPILALPVRHEVASMSVSATNCN